MVKPSSVNGLLKLLELHTIAIESAAPKPILGLRRATSWWCDAPSLPRRQIQEGKTIIYAKNITILLE